MRWHIEDFKGIASASIDITPGRRTILTGVNSSGKSSLIQSLLLVAQSLHSDSQLTLNGPLVRLGDAQDLMREDASHGAIRLSIGGASGISEETTSESTFKATFELVPAEDRSLLRVRHIELDTDEYVDKPLVVGRENSRMNDMKAAIEATRQVGASDALHVKRLLGSERRQLRTYVTMQGLQPVAFVQLLDPAEIYTRYKSAIETLLSDIGAEGKPAPRSRVNTSPYVREFVRLLIQGTRKDDVLRGTVEQFRTVRTGSPLLFQETWVGLSQEEQAACIDKASRTRQTRPNVYIPIRGAIYRHGIANGLLESNLSEKLIKSILALGALSDSLEEIADRIQYLGPLRDEPRVLWNHWNELARGLPVGTRGEYSAAVLSRAASRTIQYFAPVGAIKEASLGEAVNEWLAYLDIGETVEARSHGKLGVGLDLRVEGHIRDLTSVGVGVSQALPLLVGLLTAPEESLFIIEQPELHLHPAVQSRLADFMLRARPDLALIVETHSEAFVTRIRRRSAEGTVNTASIDITFVETSPTGSRARVLALSEYGDLSEWPVGFLSSSEEDVRAIIDANIYRAQDSNQ
ncbi:AAA family ATPase [Clavibacter michiganensis]|uniref:AAA family ATPase n=1 Tax=Clavibacter michiganensis TaxID=28447 RepID=UPI003EBA6FB7